MRERLLLVLLLFIVGVAVSGFIIGYLSAPGVWADPWYSSLDKPFFNPPPWLFAPVWTLLYILIGIAGWRAWVTHCERLQRIWWAALVMNLIWPPVFFRLEMIDGAMAVILILDWLVALFLIEAYERDRMAFWLFIPYIFWLVYASLLNAALLILN